MFKVAGRDVYLYLMGWMGRKRTVDVGGGV